MPQTYLMLLWHQHQPFYKDLAENSYTMPWVRLHALKDYYGMVAELRAFPDVHLTVNMVPSLVAQLQEYARDKAHEEAFDVAFKPAADLTLYERQRLLHYAFQMNKENLLYRYPRLRELYEKANPAEQGVRLAAAFTETELCDLQVLSQVAWFDELWLADDSEIRSLASQGRGFTEAQKIKLRRKEIELIGVVLDEHRAAEERGQIEISTSPYYHPILPLLCDSEIASQSHPGVRLPAHRFHHPEDAAAQLRTARELHHATFGRDPVGLWPSEGSISEEALALAVAAGFRWAASDEGVLGRSLDIRFARQPDGRLWGGSELYRPQRLETTSGPIDLFFRDHEISDLIGFVFSGLPPETAATALVDRIVQAGKSTGDRAAVVSVILDGENAWEYYPQNGRPFFRTFYGMLQKGAGIRAVTASEALAAVEPGRLPRLVPGSWINANFDVWIGAEEDNRAWDLLSSARDFFTANSTRPDLDPASVRLAEQEIWVAEGSDWNWWYGPEHTTENDEEFDRLYRTHLSNIYRLLGASPPDILAVPLKRPRARALSVDPSGPVEATVDGLVTNYFEWLGAGTYTSAAPAGSMHGSSSALDLAYYGCGKTALFVRLDLNRVFLQSHSEFEVRLGIQGATSINAHVQVTNLEVGEIKLFRDGQPVPRETIGSAFQVAMVRVFEASADFSLVGASSAQPPSLQISVWENELPVQVVPQEGWLKIKSADDLPDW